MQAKPSQAKACSGPEQRDGIPEWPILELPVAEEVVPQLWWRQRLQHATLISCNSESPWTSTKRRGHALARGLQLCLPCLQPCLQTQRRLLCTGSNQP